MAERLQFNIVAELWTTRGLQYSPETPKAAKHISEIAFSEKKNLPVNEHINVIVLDDDWPLVDIFISQESPLCVF